MIKIRLWHYKLIPYLPNEQLVSQWRECIAIKRQWEKGTLKHRLVSYVMDYDKNYFIAYVLQVVAELENRNIEYNKKLWSEILTMTSGNFSGNDYPEHNDRYLRQCFYNLEEKYDRGIITQTEWEKILECAYKENIIE